MPEQETNKILDEFHYHEALDRCYCVEVIIQEMLLDHPVMEKHEEWRSRIEKAQELIAGVYQAIGSRENG